MFGSFTCKRPRPGDTGFPFPPPRPSPAATASALRETDTIASVYSPPHARCVPSPRTSNPTPAHELCSHSVMALTRFPERTRQSKENLCLHQLLRVNCQSSPGRPLPDTRARGPPSVASLLPSPPSAASSAPFPL